MNQISRVTARKRPVRDWSTDLLHGRARAGARSIDRNRIPYLFVRGIRPTPQVSRSDCRETHYASCDAQTTSRKLVESYFKVGYGLNSVVLAIRVRPLDGYVLLKQAPLGQTFLRHKKHYTRGQAISTRGRHPPHSKIIPTRNRPHTIHRGFRQEICPQEL